ncbi:MauE/DoxX family redox-associated membrane protein [Echinicola sp. 20G]|uniref:MauE/DoxX family redox-associated membrane protein n=1 Tax=Echinicola sp. 20G TaxID=2781961 RepID=UPI0019107790|nr:MauE/DoxX family redox-associated membrane protein [Echinicola sp. 20G]
MYLSKTLKIIADNHREIMAHVLAFLYTYTAISKWYDWEATRISMSNQVFPEWLGTIILYFLPPAELALAILLLGRRTVGPALWVSLGLLTVFTGYIFLVLMGIFDRVPCSCGGVLSALGWGEHLVFNLCFMALNLIGIYKSQSFKKRKAIVGN